MRVIGLPAARHPGLAGVPAASSRRRCRRCPRLRQSPLGQYQVPVRGRPEGRGRAAGTGQAEDAAFTRLGRIPGEAARQMAAFWHVEVRRLLQRAEHRSIEGERRGPGTVRSRSRAMRTWSAHLEAWSMGPGAAGTRRSRRRFLVGPSAFSASRPGTTAIGLHGPSSRRASSRTWKTGWNGCAARISWPIAVQAAAADLDRESAGADPPDCLRLGPTWERSGDPSFPGRPRSAPRLPGRR